MTLQVAEMVPQEVSKTSKMTLQVAHHDPPSGQNVVPPKVERPVTRCRRPQSGRSLWVGRVKCPTDVFCTV